MTPTFWLSCHVDYACRHSGACCRSGWPLPVDDSVVTRLDDAVRSGRLRTDDGRVLWLRETAEAPQGMAGTFRLISDACVFHTAGPAGPATPAPPSGRHCAVHATLGHDALPSACQHFPRVCLIDGRGVRVSLSHFCPTAAAMLVDAVAPVTIVAGPPAVPGLDLPEGLDAREQLPPRLTARVLMDAEGMTAWEAHLVATLAGPEAMPGSVDEVLRRLAADAARLTRWTPAAGSLTEAVQGLREPARQPDAPPPATLTPADAYAIGQRACRAPWSWPALPANLAQLDARWVAPHWAAVSGVVRRYLAGKAFGAWIAWQADAAQAVVASLLLAHRVLRVECARAAGASARHLDRDTLIAALREADRLLVHHADSRRLADALAPHRRH